MISRFSNLDGALFTFVFLEFIAPTEKPARPVGVGRDVIVFVVFLVVSFVLIERRERRTQRQALDWLETGRTPTEQERSRTLGLPIRMALQPMLAWIGAALVFGLGSLFYGGHSFAYSLVITGAVLLGGVVSAAIAFLLIERACRPLFALALAGSGTVDTRAIGVRPRLILAWVLGSGVPLVALAFLPYDARYADANRNIAGAVVAMAVLGLVTGLITVVAAAATVSEPLGDVRRALARVQAGDLSVSVDVDDGGEVGRLQSGVNEMVAGLRERARLEDLFGKHVGIEVASRALEQSTGLESEQREASALFVDLIGSTAMAEVLPPGEVVATLNDYFGCVVRVVADLGGWVNKFEGDGALCVFGAPATQPDHAARALRSARRLRTDLAELRASHPGLDVAIGVSSGVLVAGNVGTEVRYEYTVIGRPVNEAARLTDLAKVRASRVLASSGALERAGEEATRWVSVGNLALRGQSAPVEVFEPVAVREPMGAVRA